MARFGEINAQYFDDSGDPLGSGKLYFYDSGTTTLKTTFSDINQTIANTNPVILTAAGRQPNIFFSGNAKAILADSSDVQILVRDPVGQTASAFGDAWVATKIYDSDAVVLGSDGVYYRSLVSANQNNDPTSTSGYWTLLYSIEWNAGITYSAGDVVTVGTTQFQSLQNNNLNQNPATQPSFWVSIAFAWLSTQTYAIHQNVVGPDGILYTSLQNSNLNNTPASSGAYWVGTSAAAAASATAAAGSASTASTQATAAAASATTATTQATAATTAKTAAETAKTAAETAQTAAETAKTNAETAETNAANSASASATSAAAALVSQNAAATSATAAASSESTVATDAAAASTSATNASNSATAAAGSATTATTQASTATTQATTATTKAGEAATSATAAATSATASATSATASAGSATSSAGSATSAASSLTSFNAKYLGASATVPSGTAAGQLYFNTTSNTMFVYSGSSWAAAGSAVNGTAERQEYTATAGQTSFNATYDVGFVDVYLNGSKLIPTTDFTATNGSQIVLGTGASVGDNVSIIAYGAFNVADVYTQSQSNARYMQLANNLSDVASAPTALTNLGLTADAAEINKLDGMTASKAELNYLSGVTSNIQTQINNVGGGNEASFVASGAISSKAPVILKSDGKAAAVAQTTIATSFATPAVLDATATPAGDMPSICYHEAENCVVAGFADSGNSYYGTIVCGTVNADKTITWDWANRLVHDSGGTSYYHALVYSQRSGNNRVGIFFEQGGGAASRGYCRVISVSGTTPSAPGNKSQFSNNYPSLNFVAKIDSTTASDSTVIVTYTEQSSPYKTYARGFQVGSSSMSYGNQFDLTFLNSTECAVSYHPTTAQFCIFYRDDASNQYYGKMATLTNSGTTISSINNITTYASSYVTRVRADYSANDDRFLLIYADNGDGLKGKCFSVSLSGTTLSLGGASATTFLNSSTGSQIGVSYHTVAAKFIIAYQDVTNDDSDMKVATLSSSDHTVTLSAATEIQSNGGYYFKMVYDPDRELTALLYQDADSPNDLYSTAILPGYDSTNLTSTNFLGFADAAISDGASGAVILEGAVIEGLSSLTIGSTYYILPTGALSTSAGTPSVTAGMAISATSINMRGATS